MYEVDYDSEYADENPEDMLENFTIQSVDVPNSRNNEIHITALVSGKPLELKINSGAKCNVISSNTLSNLNFPVSIDPSKN